MLAKAANPTDATSQLLTARLEASWASWLQDQGRDPSDRIVAGEIAIRQALTLRPELEEARELEIILMELQASSPTL